MKKERDEEHLDLNIRIPKSLTTGILIWRKILEFLSHSDDYFKETIFSLKLRLDKIVKYWV